LRRNRTSEQLLTPSISRFWDSSEILKTYGMTDPSAKDVTQDQKNKILEDIMRMFDQNGNYIVEREEWTAVMADGKTTLPDFGLGPGHHWDMETEYEIHHWEK
jgi:methionine aminopeptidase